MNWEVHHDDYLRDCLLQGMSASRAADALNANFGTNLSRCAVLSRANRRQMAHNRGHSPETGATPKKKTKPAPAPIVSIKACAPVKPAPICVGFLQPLNLPLIELKEHNCRWPFGGWPETTPITFCGHPKYNGAPYCAEHVAKSERRSEIS